MGPTKLVVINSEPVRQLTESSLIYPVDKVHFVVRAECW